MQQQPGQRILVVEDEAAIAEPFTQALRREGFDPRWERTAAGALEAARRDEPDAVILDLMLPDGDGRDVCRELRRTSDVPIIMLTARGTETDRIVGLELGADDYVVKPFSGAEVIARIRAILRRRPAPAPEAASTEPSQVGDSPSTRARAARGPTGRRSTSRAASSTCSPELARDAGRVVTREDLIADVWDENWFGSTKTLDVHVGTLRRKLGEDPAVPRHPHGPRRRLPLRPPGDELTPA